MTRKPRETRAQRAARDPETPPGAYQLYGAIGCSHGVEKRNTCKRCVRESQPHTAKVLGVRMAVQR